MLTSNQGMHAALTGVPLDRLPVAVPYIFCYRPTMGARSRGARRGPITPLTPLARIQRFIELGRERGRAWLGGNESR